MSTSNGSLVASRPSSHRRLDLVFQTATAAAEAEARRSEEEALHRERTDHLHDQLTDRANQMARAVQRYQAQLDVVRRLYAQSHADAARPDITAAEKVMGDALVTQQIDKHREEMAAILRGFMGDGADVKRVVDADIRKLASDVDGKQVKGLDIERD